jgi:hypothetical protein
MEMSRRRRNPQIPLGASRALFQIVSRAVSSADSTVVALMTRVTALTQAASTPRVCCELCTASRRILAVEGPNKPVSWWSISPYAAADPMTTPAMVEIITRSGASENAQ